MLKYYCASFVFGAAMGFSLGLWGAIPAIVVGGIIGYYGQKAELAKTR